MAFSTDKRQLFVIGLPGAGKTTFLAALWHVVESHEADGALKLVKLRGDATYLNDIRSLWADAQKLERTKLGDETNVLMALEAVDGRSCDLWIPDLSGEAFEAQWTDRLASKDYCNWVRESSGGLLFIHPNIREEHLISDINALLPSISQSESEDSVSAQDDSEVETVPWDPRVAPTQVQLVDLVQSLVMIRESQPVRLAVVVSAWDRISDDASPEQWVAMRLPLLHQYLMSHPATIDVTFFGISAQGADFETPGAIDRMRSWQKPSDRIHVRDREDRGHDITAPIRWLMQFAFDERGVE